MLYGQDFTKDKGYDFYKTGKNFIASMHIIYAGGNLWWNMI